MAFKAQQIIQLCAFMALGTFHLIVHGLGMVWQQRCDEAAYSKCIDGESCHGTFIHTDIANQGFRAGLNFNRKTDKSAILFHIFLRLHECTSKQIRINVSTAE